MVIQVAMVVVALVFGFLIANGKIDSIWHIYGYMMVSGITHSFVQPTRQALIANTCLLYTSDAADDTPCVDLGGRRIFIK